MRELRGTHLLSRQVFEHKNGGRQTTGWVLQRDIPHWYISMFRRGDLLIEVPGRHPALPGVAEPWSLWRRDGGTEEYPWHAVHGIASDVVRDLERMDGLLWCPDQYDLRAAQDSVADLIEVGYGDNVRAYFVERFASGVGEVLGAGDVVLFLSWEESRKDWRNLVRGASVRGSVRPATREQLEALRAMDQHDSTLPPDDAPSLFDITPFPANHWDLRGFLRNRRQWNGRPRVLIVRPFAEPVSDPIHAMSDLGALFELVASSGGRLTTDESFDQFASKKAARPDSRDRFMPPQQRLED